MIHEHRFDCMTRGLVCGPALINLDRPVSQPIVRKRELVLGDIADLTRQPLGVSYKVIVRSREGGEVLWMRPFATKPEAYAVYLRLIGADTWRFPFQVPQVWQDGELEYAFATVTTFSSTTNNSAADWSAGGTKCPSGVSTADYLIVAGGGAGGADAGGGTGVQGGGGAGGYLAGTGLSVTAGTNYPATVGAGGSASHTWSNTTGNGGNSSWSAVGTTAVGGGAGASQGSSNTGAGGGSGGGGSTLGNPASAYTAGQGNAGGAGGYGSGGGGGGAGGAGAAGAAGTGGAGLSNSITGSSVGYAGGGAGAPYGSGATSFGGGSQSTNGTANRGGGGGAPGSAVGAGGSGVIILSWIQISSNTVFFNMPMQGL